MAGDQGIDANVQRVMPAGAAEGVR